MSAETEELGNESQQIQEWILSCTVPTRCLKPSHTDWGKIDTEDS